MRPRMYRVIAVIAAAGTIGGLPPPDMPGQWCPDVLEPPVEVEPLAPVEPLFDDEL